MTCEPTAIPLLACGSETSKPRCLLVTPPFHSQYRPSLGLHTLQACARRAGFETAVHYANLDFAARIGEASYEAFVDGGIPFLFGERVFARAAFDRPSLAADAVSAMAFRANVSEVSFDDLLAIEREAGAFCGEIGERLAAYDCDVVGCTTMMEQTAASIAILASVKRARPQTITILGGANCQGVMAEAVAALHPVLDHVFSGESDDAFPRFLQMLREGRRDSIPRVVRGAPCENLDALPIPDFSEYFEQLAAALPHWRERPIRTPCETSRGCWWGQKVHCLFCGLNAGDLTFRQKSPERAFEDLSRLASRYPERRIEMTDNIMPHQYFATLLPRLAQQRLRAPIFYEQKANLSLAKVRLLAEAGVTRIQPGIEALSNSLLRRLRKGALARQNIATLRYCESAGVMVAWNLLTDIPGDAPEDYRQTIEIMPLLHHLQPPWRTAEVAIDRFSPYFEEPERFGIRALSPRPGYRAAFPPHADLNRLASVFDADYHSVRRDEPATHAAFVGAAAAWRAKWADPDRAAPVLHVTPIGEDEFLLFDTRGVEDCAEFRVINRAEAAAALSGGPIDRAPLARRAIAAKLAVELDGWSVPLATADLDVLAMFEAEKGASRASTGAGVNRRRADCAKTESSGA